MSSSSARQTLYPPHFTANATPSTGLSTGVSGASSSFAATNRHRQYSHLHAQLATLNAHLADMENLLRMTAVQADYVRGLGGWTGGLFMAASKILGEETTKGPGAEADGEARDNAGAGSKGEGESE